MTAWRTGCEGALMPAWLRKTRGRRWGKRLRSPRRAVYCWAGAISAVWRICSLLSRSGLRRGSPRERRGGLPAQVIAERRAPVEHAPQERAAVDADDARAGIRAGRCGAGGFQRGRDPGPLQIDREGADGDARLGL